MKHLLTVLSLFVFFFAKGQVYQKNTLYGTDFHRLDVYTALGVPLDTFQIPIFKRGQPHFAIKNEVPYTWSVVNQRWINLPGGTGTVNVTRSIVKGTGDSALQLYRDTLLTGPNTTPIAYQIINGERQFAPIKSDTSDIWGMKIMAAFPSIDSLRSSLYYQKGLRRATTTGYWENGDGGGGTWIYDPTSTAVDDGIYVVRPASIGSGSPGRWLTTLVGPVTAARAGIKNDGADQTSRLNTVMANSKVKKLIVDNGSIKITGKVNGQNKRISFDNDGMIVGAAGDADTLTNFYIEALYNKQCFDTLLKTTKVGNKVVSIMWYGGKPDGAYGVVNPTPNNTSFFNAAYSMRVKGEVYFPGAETEGNSDLGTPWWAYYFDRLLNIPPDLYGLTVAGDGREATRLVFPLSAGIKIRAGNSYFHDFTVHGYWGSTSLRFNDTAQYGISVEGGHAHLERIEVLAFASDGVRFHGDDGGGAGGHGSDGASLKDAKLGGNGRYGCIIYGNDASAITFDNINFSGNGRIGLYNVSAFGITATNIQSASQGSQHFTTKSVVYHFPHTWAALQDNTGVVPGTDTTIWVKIWGNARVNTVVPDWSADTAYVRGGIGIVNENETNLSAIIGYYSESDQWACVNNNSGTIMFQGLGTGFGRVQNSISVRDNELTAAKRLQVYSTTKDFAAIIDGNVPYIGYKDNLTAVNGGWGWETNYGMRSVWNSSADGSIYIFHPGNNALFGRTVTENEGRTGVLNGLWHRVKGTSTWRNISMSQGIPTGDYAVGDVIFNQDDFKWYVCSDNSPLTFDLVGGSGGSVSYPSGQIGYGTGGSSTSSAELSFVSGAASDYNLRIYNSASSGFAGILHYNAAGTTWKYAAGYDNTNNRTIINNNSIPYTIAQGGSEVLTVNADGTLKIPAYASTGKYFAPDASGNLVATTFPNAGNYIHNQSGTTQTGEFKIDGVGSSRTVRSMQGTSYSEFRHNNAGGSSSFPRAFFTVGNPAESMSNAILYIHPGVNNTPVYSGLSTHADPTTTGSVQSVMSINSGVINWQTFDAEGSGTQTRKTHNIGGYPGGTPSLILNSDATVTMPNLAGTGDRIISADINGTMSKTTIDPLLITQTINTTNSLKNEADKHSYVMPSFSGDNTTTAFAITSTGIQPTFIGVTPNSPDAAAYTYAEWTSTAGGTITIYFNVAPPTGTGNVKFSIHYRK